MATKPNKRPPAKSSPAAVIKWTDDEWEMIAKQLYTTLGPSVMTSEHLDEVKAKNIFLAQESALPQERHRKLISISQGFQAVRQRLKTIFVEAAAAYQKQVLEAEPHNSEAKSPVQRNAEKRSKNLSSRSSVEQQAHISDAKGAAANISPKKPRGKSNVLPANAPRANSASGQADDVAVLPVSPVTAKRGHAVVATPLPDPAAAASGEAQSASQDAHQAGRIAAPLPTTGQSRATEGPPALTSNLNEIVRPFIAMVCQELVHALLDAASKPANRDALSAIMRQAQGHADTTALTRSGNHDQARLTTSPHRPTAHPAPSPLAKGAASNSVYPATSEDEDGDAENDVQPLFDPKLPPSANSTFKPTVGVVGASVQDFSDLQQMYPQLMLIAVAVDDVPHAPALGQCQRVVGLREDVPAKTDEVLRHTFRNRYLRLTGGMARVREQLDVWLDKPGSTQTRRPKFNKQRNNKGIADGPKKRHGNPPRKPG